MPVCKTVSKTHNQSMQWFCLSLFFLIWSGSATAQTTTSDRVKEFRADQAKKQAQDDRREKTVAEVSVKKKKQQAERDKALEEYLKKQKKKPRLMLSEMFRENPESAAWEKKRQKELDYFLSHRNKKPREQMSLEELGISNTARFDIARRSLYNSRGGLGAKPPKSGDSGSPTPADNNFPPLPNNNNPPNGNPDYYIPPYNQNYDEDYLPPLPPPPDGDPYNNYQPPSYDGNDYLPPPLPPADFYEPNF